MTKKTNEKTDANNANIIARLLDALRVCDDKTMKKTIRRQLRRHGHRGALMHERAQRNAQRIDELIARAHANKTNANAINVDDANATNDATNDANE